MVRDTRLLGVNLINDRGNYETPLSEKQVQHEGHSRGGIMGLIYYGYIGIILSTTTIGISFITREYVSTYSGFPDYYVY
jgi:hypothetical protein